MSKKKSKIYILHFSSVEFRIYYDGFPGGYLNSEWVVDSMCGIRVIVVGISCNKASK